MKPIPTRIAPLDFVLGGGLWPGSLTIVRGALGSGKTTLLTQICCNLQLKGPEHRPLLATPIAVEERKRVLERIRRLGGGTPRWQDECDTLEGVILTAVEVRRAGAIFLDGYRIRGSQANWLAGVAALRKIPIVIAPARWSAQTYLDHCSAVVVEIRSIVGALGFWVERNRFARSPRFCAATLGSRGFEPDHFATASTHRQGHS